MNATNFMVESTGSGAVVVLDFLPPCFFEFALDTGAPYVNLLYHSETATRQLDALQRAASYDRRELEYLRCARVPFSKRIVIADMLAYSDTPSSQIPGRQVSRLSGQMWEGGRLQGSFPFHTILAEQEGLALSGPGDSVSAGHVYLGVCS